MTLVEVVSRQAAILRMHRLNPALRVRIHPLDAASLARGQTTKPGGKARLLRVAGCQVELDCAVERGRPEVEYDMRPNAQP